MAGAVGPAFISTASPTCCRNCGRVGCGYETPDGSSGTLAASIPRRLSPRQRDRRFNDITQAGSNDGGEYRQSGADFCDRRDMTNLEINMTSLVLCHGTRVRYFSAC